MKAMIFAAGLGTRLYPLTRNKPKALVKIGGKTLLEWAIEKLKSHGVNEIIINIHAFADQIEQFVKENNTFEIRIEFSNERKKLLDTGGGLVHAAHFFDDQEPFIVYNVDVISDIDLSEMLSFHRQTDAMVTLGVRKRKSSRYLLFDSKNRLQGWENIKTNQQILLNKEKLDRFAFSGIHIINPSIFDLIFQQGTFSIIPTYLELARQYQIVGFDHSYSLWMDMGKISEINKYLDILKEKGLV